MAGEQELDVAAFASAYEKLAEAVRRAAPEQPGPFAVPPFAIRV